MGNAIKFTQNDGKISVKVRRDENFCEISVIDNGVGISESEIEKIFRVQLSKTVANTIKNAFGLLGIQVPERM